jgi:acetyl-CoA carboxylase carboxyl transferase subunit alpha
MLEHSIYSVISPEGCAAILWDSNAKAPDAADAMKITSKDLLDLGVIDEIVPEPIGGAHRDPPRAAQQIDQAILRHLDQLVALPAEELLRRRYDKFRRMGIFLEQP